MISFVCPLCGHQVTAAPEEAGQRITCPMCNFKVEVPRPVVVPLRPKPPPPLPPPPVVETPPPPAPAAADEESFESLPEFVFAENESLEELPRRGIDWRVVVGVVGILAVIWLCLTTPTIYQRLPWLRSRYEITDSPHVPKHGPLSPADNDPAPPGK